MMVRNGLARECDEKICEHMPRKLINKKDKI